MKNGTPVWVLQIAFAGLSGHTIDVTEAIRKCDLCDEPAFYYVTLVVDGKVESAAFCPKHAESCGILDPVACHLLGRQETVTPEHLEDRMPRCENCGITYFEFERKGRLGCPQCYEAFGSMLKPILNRMQMAPSHLGKIPRKSLQKRLLDDRILALQGRLNTAISEERFEEAATLRDQISDMRLQAEQVEQ